MPVDFGLRSDDYARYRPGFPASFYDRLDRLAPIGGSRALDLGTGPGTLARELARRGAQVTGVDVAPNQIRAAEECARDEGVGERCTFRVGRAEDLPFAEAAFDLAVAGQCWHWFDAKAVLRELARVLRPGGHLAIAHDSYLPDRPLAAATERLVLAHNPAWTMAGEDGLHPAHIGAVIAGGFDLVEQFCYDHDQLFTHAGWRGRMRTSSGVGSGGMTEARVEAFDLALADLLQRDFPAEPLVVRHRVWATVARRP